jgi:hypothetical protein
MKHCIQVKIVAVSSNRNSFGLAGVIGITRTGLAVEAGASYLGTPRKGEVIRVPVRRTDLASPTAFAYAVARHRGWEIPRPLPTAPRTVAKEVWTR